MRLAPSDDGLNADLNDRSDVISKKKVTIVLDEEKEQIEKLLEAKTKQPSKLY